ncbi:MAG: c-type cytochrome [Bryobacterales bacterium]|nr:c-type cytochrome [Bryobacterales bacterium]
MLRLSLLLATGLLVLAAAARDKPKIKQAPPSRTDPVSGQQMFRAYCSPCHGLLGTGDGPAAAALKNKPVNLTELSARNGGKFPALKVYNTIQGDTMAPAHGSKDMPVWGDVFRSMTRNEAEAKMRINNLTRYMESIQHEK